MSQRNKAAADAADDDVISGSDEPQPEGQIDAGDAFDEEFTDAITDALNEDTESGAGDADDDEDEDLELADGLDESDNEEAGEDEDDGPDLDDLLDEEDDQGAGEKPEQPRDEKGQFTKAEDASGAKAADAKPGEQPADKTVNAGVDDKAANATKDGKAAEPAWEPLSVNANKESVAIGEARVLKADGHVYVAIAEKDYPRFQQRLSRGIVGEQLFRQLNDGLRELEARKNAPPPPSENEIEAKKILEILTPMLPELLDEKDLALLEAQIKVAKVEARQEYEKTEAARLAKASEPQWDEQQAEGIAKTMLSLVQQFPELKGLTREQLEDIYERELLPVRAALYYREGDQLFANTQYMYDRLKARIGSSASAGSAPAADAPANGNTGTTNNTGNTGKTGAAPTANDASASTRTPGSGKTPGNSAPTAKPTTKKGNAADSAERFNRGVDQGAKPRSTSVKNNRTSSAPAKRTTRTSERDDRRPTRDSRDEQMAAEDAVRRSQRNWLKSDSLDFDDEADAGDEA